MNSRLKQLGISILLVSVFACGAFATALDDLKLIQSDQPVDLNELIDIAVENESNYRKVLEDKHSIRLLEMNAIGQYLPSISLSGGMTNYNQKTQSTYVEGRFLPGVDSESSSSRWQLNATENLFTGFQRLYNTKSANLRAANIRLTARRSHDELVANVKTFFYNYLATERNLDVQREVLNQLNEAYRLAKTRFETGDVIHLDVMKAEIDLGTQENAVLEAEQALENAREALNLAVGIHLDSKFPLEGNLAPVLPTIDQNIMCETAFANRPDLKMMENLVKIYNNDAKAVRGQYFPMIQAGVGYSKSESSDKSFDFNINPEGKSTSIGLQFSWNIFDGFTREYQRQAAVVNKRKAEWDVRYTRETIDSQLRTNWRALNKLYKQVQVLDRNRDLARQSLEMEQQRYQIGAIDQLTLKTAQVTFITAEQTYLSTVREFFITLAWIERDLGMTLTYE